MKILKISLLTLLLTCLFVQVKAQLLINTNGQDIALTEGAILTIPNSAENLGTITNNGGFIYLSGDWTNSGTYGGEGHFILDGTSVQTIDHDGQSFFVLTIEGGGNKVLVSDINILDSLMLANGIVDGTTNDKSIILQQGSRLAGGSALSYVSGGMSREGTGDLFYPIGKNGNYTPATLIDVQGENPRVKLEVFESNPMAVADSGLVSVSTDRYWQRTVESGTFSGSRVSLTINDETGISSINKAVVAGGPALSGDFKNFGRANASGDIADGNIESTGFLNAAILAIGEELNENRVADSLVLRALYESTDGDNWTNNSNWNSNQPIDQWFGVTITNDRVSGLSLPSNNLSGSLTDGLRLLTELENLDLSGNALSGELSASFTELTQLATIDLSNNELVGIPDLGAMSAITSIDISNNKLLFTDIIPNVGITGIVYAPQSVFGEEIEVKLAEGEETTLSISTDHQEDTYQWFKDEEPIPGFISPNILLTDVGFEEMGEYTCEVKNANVPDLTLTSAPQQLIVTSTLSGNVLLASDNSAFSAGQIILFAEGSFGFDTLSMQDLGSDGSFLFDDVALGDYFLQVLPDDRDGDFMATYYESTILTQDATLIALRTAVSDITLLELEKPQEFTEEEGNNTVSGFFEIEEEFLISNARIEARRRVRLAGVSLYRSKTRNSRKEELLVETAAENEIDLTDWDLVAYTQTNDEGEFSFENVPDGVYRIIIDYPGIPVAEGSEIDFTLSEEEDQTDVTFEAAIDDPEVGIVVTELTVTHSKYDLVSSLGIYPNPVGDYLTVVLDSKKRFYEVELSIIDIQGRRAYSTLISGTDSRQGHKVLDVSDMKPGVYSVILTDPEGDEGPLKYAKLMITR